MREALTYGSVCSGIEAASVAWHPLGWRAAFVSEIEAFPRAVLKHHWPEVPLHGDFTTINGGDYAPIDLLVGGTPCQSFSVAGLRGGLDDDRGNLALEYLRLADRLRPRWLVWENVPGVLSSNGGRDFGSILGGMGELGYGVAYRVLDAQFFGVAQRRRRVFVVGHLGDWRRAAAVLFERHGLSGHPAPSRQARERVARPIAAGSPNGSGYRNDADPADNLIEVVGALPAGGTPRGHGTAGVNSQAVAAGHVVPVMTLAIRGRDGKPDLEWREDGTANAILTPNGGRAGIGVGAIAFGWQNSSHQGDSVSEDHSPALDKSKVPAVAYNITPSNSNKDYNARASDRAQALTGGGNRPSARGGDLIAGTVRSHTRPGSNEVGSIVATSAVRRLTPRECERLQGFPDDYTLIPWRKGFAADGPRYKALGNSMAVPCMAWIGRRIDAVEVINERAAPADIEIPSFLRRLADG